MRTKNLDVVYFVKNYASKDLVYSIRSVAKNLEYRNLWICGGKPAGIEPDGYVRRTGQSGNKWDNVKKLYRDVCLTEEISDDFILFHDDFFIMKKVREIKPEYRSTLEAHIRAVERAFGPLPNEYSKILRKARRALTDVNKGTLSYELHKPFIFNKHKLLETMGIFPNTNAVRSLYANFWELGGEQAHDIKIFDNKPDFDYKSEPILSTDDTVSRDGNSYWEYIKGQFLEPCRYEKPNK